MRDFPDTLFMSSFFPSKVENSCWVVHLVTSFMCLNIYKTS